MGGWTGRGKDGIYWNGQICAESFCGDGSQLTGVSGGGITNLDGGNSADTYGAVGLSPIDGGDST